MAEKTESLQGLKQRAEAIDRKDENYLENIAQLCDEALMILDPVVNKEETEKISKVQRDVGNLRSNSKEITENKKDIALMELKEAIDQALEREGKKL